MIPKGRRTLVVVAALWERPCAAAAPAAPLLLYLLTLAPGLVPGDSGDAVVAAATWREAHPPGYPLYALLGKVFAHLPLPRMVFFNISNGYIDEVAWRVNLMSAVCTAAAAGLVYAALRLLTGRRLPALVGAGLFAVGRLFWSYAVVAEVFALNNLFLALLTFLAVRWRAGSRGSVGSMGSVGSVGSPAGGAPRTSHTAHTSHTPTLLAVAAGLSLGNHHSMLLTFPGLALFLLLASREARRPGKTPPPAPSPVHPFTPPSPASSWAQSSPTSTSPSPP